MLILALALLQTAAAAPVCTATDAALPAAMAGWTVTGASFAPGQAVTLAATDPGAVTPPQKPGGVATVTFTIASPGPYRIAVDKPGWIEVTAAGTTTPLTASVHGHGPVCSTIKKFVGYDFAAGSYTLKISGLAQPTVKAMLVEGNQ